MSTSLPAGKVSIYNSKEQNDFHPMTIRSTIYNLAPDYLQLFGKRL
ncbi:MAG: hypothetical protein HKN34_09850 [Gammaproteobacteria bacterium]|nr:hypothetical protein [Gammaproteobacteria bacterium]